MNTTERIEQLKDQVLPFRPFEAMEEAENLVNANPRDAESHFFLASIYKLLNRHHEAALTFEKTYELENSAHPALFNAGICFNELGQPDQALKFFDRAAEAAVRAAGHPRAAGGGRDRLRGPRPAQRSAARALRQHRVRMPPD